MFVVGLAHIQRFKIQRPSAAPVSSFPTPDTQFDVISQTKRSQTTTSYPQTNGMVNHFHQQLKPALKAQPNINAWMETVPIILLGICTALKEDLNATMTEMVYGTTLCLPGEFSFASLSYPPT